MIWWLKKQWLRIRLYAYENYQNEAESLIIWYAVAFALGAAFYFALKTEPSIFAVTTAFELILLLLYLNRKKEAEFKLLTYAAIFLLGLCMAKADALYQTRNIDKSLPKISYLHGKVENLDYNSNNRLRLLLREVDNYENNLKGRFFISLSYAPAWLKPGTCVELVAKLPQNQTPNPLSNYNAKRENFYKGISASGYGISPVFETDCREETSNLQAMINRARAKVKVAAEQALPDIAPIIKALAIGDKSAISKTQSANYRTAGLAHFLAISGMHMSIIALLVFFIIRALFFFLGEGRYDLRKPAALAAFAFITVYFLISGQSVSCKRAYIMTTLVLAAVLFNRRAISLRLWALALIIVTALTPHAVITPGFLMSFAASLGLISFYEKYAFALNRPFHSPNLLKRVVAYFIALIITDLVASLMTLPYTLYYFRQVSVYTSLGNLLAGPVIAFAVMPSLLLFLLSLPFGLENYTVILLNKTIGLINQITQTVSSLPGADAGEGMGVITSGSLFLITLGLLWLCIWQAKWRRLGIIVIILGLISLWIAPTPDFVFAEDGVAFAYKNKENRLAPACFSNNKFLEKMWTGSTAKKGCRVPPNEPLSCTQKSCLYQNRIRFGKSFLEFDNQKVPLNSGGFINLKHGIFYQRQSKERIWDN